MITPDKAMKIMSDLILEWHEEDRCVHAYAELVDGKKVEIREGGFYREDPPDWVTDPSDERDYEEWYNDVLKIAHESGFVLEGELG